MGEVNSIGIFISQIKWAQKNRLCLWIVLYPCILNLAAAIIRKPPKSSQTLFVWQKLGWKSRETKLQLFRKMQNFCCNDKNRVREQWSWCGCRIDQSCKLSMDLKPCAEAGVQHGTMEARWQFVESGRERKLTSIRIRACCSYLWEREKPTFVPLTDPENLLEML